MKRCRSTGSKKKKFNLFEDKNHEKWTNSYSRMSQYWDPKYGMLYQDKHKIANIDRIEQNPLTCCGNSPVRSHSHGKNCKVMRPGTEPLYSSFGLVDKENRKIIVASQNPNVDNSKQQQYERPQFVVKLPKKQRNRKSRSAVKSRRQGRLLE